MSISGPDVQPSTEATLLPRLVEEIERQIETAVELRERLHRIAEPSNAEHETARMLGDALAPREIVPLDGAGFFTRLGDPGEPAVVVRAELDALPIVEQTGAPFAADKGYMHACGHDTHMAALTAVVHACKQLEHILPAPLVALFQPSEEAYPSGAKVIADRISDLGPIGAIVAAHVHPDVPWQSVAADEGTVNACVDNVAISVTGRAGHAAYPHQARDPVVALSQIVVNLQQIVSRRVDPMRSVAVTISRLRAGDTENVIASGAEASGTIRTLDPEDRATVVELVKAITQHVAQACGCEATVTVTEGEPAVVNDALLARHVRHALVRTGFSLPAPMRSCGSDDFGFYGQLVPSMLVFVGLAGSPGWQGVPLHHPSFLPPADAVLGVAKTQAAAYVGAAAALGREVWE